MLTGDRGMMLGVAATTGVTANARSSLLDFDTDKGQKNALNSVLERHATVIQMEQKMPMTGVGLSSSASSFL